jgi:hypothetical protein
MTAVLAVGRRRRRQVHRRVRLPGQPGLPAVADRDPAPGGGYDHRLAGRRLLRLLQAAARRLRVQAGRRHHRRRPLMVSTRERPLS